MKEIEDLKKELRNELKEEMQRLRDELLVAQEFPEIWGCPGSSKRRNVNTIKRGGKT